SPTTRCPRTSSSSTRSPTTPPARCSSTSSANPRHSAPSASSKSERVVARTYGREYSYRGPNAKRCRAHVKSVEGAVAVITGAGSGIGRATAHSLARRGCAVVVSDIDEQRAANVVIEITAEGGRAIGARCDVANDDDVGALAEHTHDAFGRVDVVMSNVGVIAKGLPLEIPL